MERLATIRLAAACTAMLLAPSTLAQTQGLGPDPFTTAIHNGPAHNGPTATGATYGTWVSGADFKASFHDGFTFYPLLGSAYPHNLPLRWVTLDGAAPATLHVTESQVRFDHGNLIEVYDVRTEGIEQSFVFDRAPATPGDLVVTGRIESPLTAKTVDSAHQELIFHGPRGEPLVRYGKAIVFDAAGLRAEARTAWNGEKIELRVGADFLANATYPVTLDPLIARVQLDTSTAPVQDLDLVRAPNGNSSQLLMLYSRVFAGNDTDSFARTLGPNYGNAVNVFADVQASRSTKEGRCAYIGDTQRWAMVFEQELNSPTTSSILSYFHPVGNTTLNSGTSGTLPVAAGTTARNPDVGGRYAGGGNNVLVVYTTDLTTTQQNTNHTEAWGVLVDSMSATTSSTPETLDWFGVGTTYDREHPTVVKMSDGDQGFWVVAWHELFRPAVPDDWDINLTRMSHNGHHVAQRYRMGLGGHPWNKRFPQLAGGNDHFLLTMTFGANGASATADEIQVQRFDWPDSEYDPDIAQPVTVSADNQTPDHAYPKVAFDTNTQSHWTVTYQRGLSNTGDLYAARVGPDGGVLESETMFSSANATGSATAVAFVPENGGSFPAVYATDEPGNPLFGTALLYPSTALNTLYGTGCDGLISATAPYIGSQYFTVSITGAYPDLPAMLGVATASANVLAPPLLLPGCYLNLDPSALLLSAMAGPTGNAELMFPIPSTLPSGFSLYFQWAFLDVVGGTLGLSTTQGLRSNFE